MYYSIIKNGNKQGKSPGMLTRPQPYEGEVVTHEVEAEAMIEANVDPRGRGRSRGRSRGRGQVREAAEVWKTEEYVMGISKN